VGPSLSFGDIAEIPRERKILRFSFFEDLPFLIYCGFWNIYYRRLSFMNMRGLICIDQPLSFNY
jgi:hypothetical protein